MLNNSEIFWNIKLENISIRTCNYLKLHVLFLSNTVRQINSPILKLEVKEADTRKEI